MHVVNIGTQWIVRNEALRVVSVHATEKGATAALGGKAKPAKRKPAKPKKKPAKKGSK